MSTKRTVDTNAETNGPIELHRDRRRGADIPRGTRLGAYEVLGPIGAGGMGVVYKARDLNLERDVAIKCLNPAFREKPEMCARFEREALAVATLSHPNIVAIFDFFTSDGTSFAVTELLQGQTLRQKLAEGPLSRRKAVDYAIQIARGLDAAHDKGMVHRDLKPDNVFITEDGCAKILDFGLAKGAPSFSSEPDPLTSPGVVVGTVGYMSPEQVRGHDVDGRSDIFGFGTVLYEMLAGRMAFWRDTVPEMLTAILREEPAELTASAPDVVPALDRIVRHCLEKDPRQRFQSARDLAFDLEALVDAPVPAAIEPAERQTSWPRVRSLLRSLSFLAAGLLAGACVAG